MLAGKCNHEPRHCKALITEVMKQYYGRDPIRSAFSSEEYLQHVIERVHDAELSLMFTLEFDFNVDALIVIIFKMVKDMPCLQYLKARAHFQQFLVSTCNDIYKRDAAMVLQYRGTDIGLAMCQLYFRWMKQKGTPIYEPPSDPDTTAPWYVAHGLSEEIHQEIAARFYKLYANIQKVEGNARAADSTGVTDTGVQGQTISMGAASSGDIGGGPARSTAAAPTLSAPSAGMPMLAAARKSSAIESTAEQPKIKITGARAAPALPAPAGGGAGPFPSGSGSGRHMVPMGPRPGPLKDPLLPPAGKRPRPEWGEEDQPYASQGRAVPKRTPDYNAPHAAGHSVFPSSQQGQQHRTPVFSNYASPYQSKGLVHGAGPTPPAPDSDKEEGELEEGEIL